jgi:hypothetical protein
MHAEDGDNLASRMEAFAELSAVPERSDGASADGGGNGKQKVNRHGVAVR